MLRRLFFVSSLSALVAVAFACSSTSNVEVPPADGGASDETDAETSSSDAAADAPAACVLDPSSKTGVAKCDDCLQSKCCQAITDCISNTDCKALNDCYAGCGSLGRGDAGVQCVRDCLKQHPKSGTKFQGALECESSSCGTVCKG